MIYGKKILINLDVRLKGKAKEDFEKWLKYNIIYCNVPDVVYWFYEVPSSMQWGVIIDWADSVGYIIELEELTQGKWYYIITYENYTKYEESNTLKTRHEAREKAIEKLNNIYNENN